MRLISKKIKICVFVHHLITPYLNFIFEGTFLIDNDLGSNVAELGFIKVVLPW